MNIHSRGTKLKIQSLSLYRLWVANIFHFVWYYNCFIASIRLHAAVACVASSCSPSPSLFDRRGQFYITNKNIFPQKENIISLRVTKKYIARDFVLVLHTRTCVTPIRYSTPSCTGIISYNTVHRPTRHVRHFWYIIVRENNL